VDPGVHEGREVLPQEAYPRLYYLEGTYFLLDTWGQVMPVQHGKIVGPPMASVVWEDEEFLLVRHADGRKLKAEAALPNWD